VNTNSRASVVRNDTQNVSTSVFRQDLAMWLLLPLVYRQLKEITRYLGQDIKKLIETLHKQVVHVY